MKTKALEIRDTATFIPALAVDMSPDDPYPAELAESLRAYTARLYLLRRCGYACDGRPNVLLMRLDGSGMATNDPYEWGGRTWPNAHRYIIEHWNELRDGDVIDVRFILGETPEPCTSERG